MTSRIKYKNYGEIFIATRLNSFKNAVKSILSGDDNKKYKILEIGCGGGGVIKDMINDGFTNFTPVGLDINFSRLKQIKFDTFIMQGDGSSLPFHDESIDIIIQATVFTSVLDDTKKNTIAKEILRVLKNDGLFLWHDFQYDNPFNKNVKGIRLKEIKKLFPRCSYEYNSLHANPLIARPISKYSVGIAEFLDRIKILHTHLFVKIKKKFT